MAKIKLDTMLDEVNCRLGNVVYSEWKGVKYVRKYTKAKYANSEAQVEVRTAFAETVALWKPLPAAVKNAWDFHAKGKPLTGYNLFFKSNFSSIKKGETLTISRGTGITAPWNMSASINASGDISVSFETGADAAQVSLFIQKTGETDLHKLLVSKIDAAGGAMPVVLNGFDPAGEYNVYAVASDAPMMEAKNISDSEVCMVMK